MTKPSVSEMLAFIVDKVKQFFSLKRSIAFLVVLLSLVFLAVMCNMHVSDTRPTPIPTDSAPCDTSCPLPKHDPPTYIKLINPDNWSFELKGNEWTPQDTDYLKNVKVALENRNVGCIIFMAKDNWYGSNYTKYVSTTIRNFMATGALFDSLKPVTINNQNFSLVTVRKNGDVYWSWVTVKNGSGYGFTCGCDIDANKKQFKMCQDAVNSLRIN